MPLVSALVGAFAAGIAGVANFAALGTIAQFAVRFVSGIILNSLGRALTKKSAPAEDSASIIGTLDQGADVPRSFIMGYYATTGYLTYHNTWGQDGATPNAYYTRATKLSDMPLFALYSLWVDDKYCTIGPTLDPNGLGYPIVGLSTTKTVTTYIRQSAGTDDAGFTHYTTVPVTTTETTQYGWIRFYDGNQVAADPVLVSNCSTAQRPWDANGIGTGVAYAVTTFRLSKDLFTQLPQLKFVVNGIPMLDYSTGTMNTANSNPVNQVAHLLNGISYGGNWFYGVQGGVNLDTAQINAEITASKAPVPGSGAMTDPEKIAAFGSTTVPDKYFSGIEIFVNEELGTVIEDILAACNGKVVDTGWKYKIYTGDIGTSVASFTDLDILSTSEQTFTPFFGLSEAINGVTAVYPEPQSFFENETAPPLYSPQFEIEDGNRRMLTSVTLRTVVFKEQVQRLVTAALKEARRARRHTITLPHAYLGLEPGDIITWTSSRNGYSSKKFRVDGKYQSPLLDVTIDITEVDPADYSWSAATDFAPTVVGTLAPPVYSDQPVLGFGANAVTIRDAASVSRKPGVFIFWNRGIDGKSGLEYEIKVTSTGDVVAHGTVFDLESGGITITSGIMPTQVYSVRARLLPMLYSAWTTPVSVTTTNIRASFDDVGFGENINFITNSNFLAGTEGWIKAGVAPASTETSWGINPAGSPYAGGSYPTMYMYQNGTGTGNAIIQNKPLTDAAGTTIFGMPATAGDWIQASVQASTIRCTLEVLVRWYDSTGAVLLTSGALGSQTNVTGSTTNPESWGRIGGKTQAPANTASVTILLRKQPTLSGVDSYAYMHKPMLTKVHQYVTNLSPYKPDGTAIVTSAHIKNLAVDNAKIANLAVTDAKIGGAIQSTGFVTGPGGTGWRIDKAGSAEFNTVTIRRQLEVDSGTIGFGGFSPSVTGSGGLFSTTWALPGYTIFVDVTGIPISAWGGGEKTYLATVDHLSGGITAPGGAPPDVYWGWVATTLPLTRWTGDQSLRLRIDFYSRNVTAVAAGSLQYKIYEVS